jgi:hypothetical protein
MNYLELIEKSRKVSIVLKDENLANPILVADDVEYELDDFSAKLLRLIRLIITDEKVDIK